MEPLVVVALAEALTEAIAPMSRTMSTADNEALSRLREVLTLVLSTVPTAESTVTLGTEPMDTHTDTDTLSHERCKCATVPCECGARCPVDSGGTASDVSTAGSGSGSASSRRPRSNTVAQRLDSVTAESRTDSGGASERSERVQGQPQTATAGTGWATEHNTLPLGMDEHGRTHADWRGMDERDRTFPKRKRLTQADMAAELAAARSPPVRSGTDSRQYREAPGTGWAKEYNTVGMDEHGCTTVVRHVRTTTPAVQRAVPPPVLSHISATESSSSTCSTGRQGGRTGDIHSRSSLEHPSECRSTAHELAARWAMRSGSDTTDTHDILTSVREGDNGDWLHTGHTTGSTSGTSTESELNLSWGSSGTLADKEHGRCGSSTDSSGSTWSSVSQSGRTSVTMADCAAAAAHHMAHCMRIGNSELRSVRRATVHNGEQLAELTDAMRTFFRVLANADTGAHSQQGHSRSHNSLHC